MYHLTSSLSDRANYIQDTRLWAAECAGNDADTLRAQIACLDAFVDLHMAFVEADDMDAAREFATQAFRDVFTARLAELE